MNLEPVTLEGQHARLEPLSLDHANALSEAVQDGELWKLWYTAIPTPAAMLGEVQRRLDLQASGSMLPFAVIHLPDERMAGMTTYMHIDSANRRLEIGSTWYRQSLQRTALNTECKRMLLGHAFEQLDCIAVEFRTHWHNSASRRGIERLGAKLDGVLRSHQIAANGSLRDTCVYSILASEWPAVRANLDHALSTSRRP
ncbi:RimL Acetyltransferases, including N-acetylases of ribosomal proteins [Burkholderiaceae bacterium]